jgi:hypothetical protein
MSRQMIALVAARTKGKRPAGILLTALGGGG